MRADLQEVYGVDLAAWWRQRRWAALLDLIDQLPGTSRLNEAIYDDPDQAALIASQPEPAERWSPRLRQWDLTHVMLQRLIHATEVGNANFAAAHGGRPGAVQAFPSPVTGVDRYRDAHRRATAHALISILTPDYA